MKQKNKLVQENSSQDQVLAYGNVAQDLKHSILIVSVVANLFVFTTWIALQVTTQYDTQLANFLFNR